MSSPRQRDLLKDAMADLPRQPTSADFTEAVLAELERRDASTAKPTGRLVWALAMSLFLMVLLTLGYGYRRQQATERAYRIQVEELKSRYQTLLDEVASVRREAAAPETRLYLGGDETLDLVLDLTQLPGEPIDRQDIRPAALEH